MIYNLCICPRPYTKVALHCLSLQRLASFYYLISLMANVSNINCIISLGKEMLHLKECPRLPKDCIHKHNRAGIKEGLYCAKHRQVEMWSRGIVETVEGPVWVGNSGTYRLEKPGWTKICDGALWGSVITGCNGKLLSIGGACSGKYSNSVKVLDEASKRWADLPPMVVPCHDPCVASTGCGDIVVMGGMGTGGIGLDVVQVFNASTQAWHRGPSLPGECWGASCAVNRDTVFMVGGVGMATSVWYAQISQLVSNQIIEMYWLIACAIFLK